MDIRNLQDLRVLVRSRRTDLGWSQGTLADRAGVSRRWVSMFETGHEAAEVGRLLAVLQALDLRLVVGPAETPPTPTNADATQTRPAAQTGLRDTLREYDQGDF